MGNEDPWFDLVVAAIMLLLLSGVAFIVVKFVLLLVRRWRRDPDA
jgi:hypothetical protein